MTSESNGLPAAQRAKRKRANMSQSSRVLLYFVKVDEISYWCNKCLYVVIVKSGNVANLMKHLIKQWFHLYQENSVSPPKIRESGQNAQRSKALRNAFAGQS